MAFSYCNSTLKPKRYSCITPPLPLGFTTMTWCDWKVFQVNSRKLVFWELGLLCQVKGLLSTCVTSFSKEFWEGHPQKNWKICRPPKHPRLLCVNSDSLRDCEIDMLAWAWSQDPHGHCRQEWFGLLSQFKLSLWKNLFYFVCMSIFPAWIFVYCKPAWCLKWPNTLEVEL